MENYFIILIYLFSVLSIFIVPGYLNLKRGRIFVLSLLPILFVASTASVIMLFSSFGGDEAFSQALTFSIFLFFEFLLFGYMMMLPILLLVAFIVEYLHTSYYISAIKLALTGGVLGAVITGITFMHWKFVWIALVSGFLSVWVRYRYEET
jgi:hypothetical protein